VEYLIQNVSNALLPQASVISRWHWIVARNSEEMLLVNRISRIYQTSQVSMT